MPSPASGNKLFSFSEKTTSFSSSSFHKVNSQKELELEVKVAFVQEKNVH